MESTTAASTQPIAQQSNTSSTGEINNGQSNPSYSVKELEIDGNKIPIEKIIERYRKSDSLDKASYQRFQEAAKEKKEAQQIKLERQQIQQRLKEDFDGFLRENGIDPLEVSEKTIRKMHDELSMSDEQRKMSEMEREYIKLKKFKEEQESRQENNQKQSFRNNVAAYIDNNLGRAFDSIKADADPYTIFSAASYIGKQIRDGVPLQHVDFNEAAQYAKKNRDESFKRDPESELKNYLNDPKLRETARKILIDSLKTSNDKPFVVNKKELKLNPLRADSKKYMTPSEFREMMENEAKNG